MEKISIYISVLINFPRRYKMEDKMKNIVVLKNLPSNIVEEAIVILKGDKRKIECIKKHIKSNSLKGEKSVNKPKDYIVKEAEMVISNYISNIENQKIVKTKKDTKKLEKRYKRMQIATIIMFIALVINIL